MAFKRLAAAALALTIAAPASAVPIELEFTFEGVTATFFGLDNGSTVDQKATSFTFTGLSDRYVVSDLVANNFNKFVFSADGGLASVDFVHAPVVMGETKDRAFLWVLSCRSIVYCYATEGDLDVPGSIRNFDGIYEVTVRELPAAVPLPAGGALLLTGLAGFAAIRRRKKIAA